MREARAQREREAAQVLAARIAEGRPPDEVWVAAALREAQRGQAAGGWYTSTTPAPPRHAPLVLRVVRLR
ncbi:MAG TPA: hypothetical protein VHF24_02150 [Acidimicrobiales bacterium]|nr:hypothetical protein [Acidimicrobiales bacterium]